MKRLSFGRKHERHDCSLLWLPYLIGLFIWFFVLVTATPWGLLQPAIAHRVHLENLTAALHAGGSNLCCRLAQALPLDSHPIEDSSTAFDPRLIGFWEHQNDHGTITLEFLSENRIVFAGRILSYCLLPGTIRVTDSAGYVDYSYQIRGQTLRLLIADDVNPASELTFRRVNFTPDHSDARSSMP